MDNHRRPLITLLLVGGGLIVYAGLAIGSSIPGEGTSAMWAILCGLPFFTLGLLTYQNNTSIHWFDAFLEKASHWLGVTQVQVILLALSPLFGFICILGAGPGQKMYSPGWAIAAWVLAIALAFLGGLRTGEEKPNMARSTLITLTLLFFFAFLVRGIATERIPILLTGDEGSSGIAAAGFVKGEWNNIFVTGWFSFPSLFYFIQSLSIRLFGQTTEALRLVSALAGALTVGCVYLFGRSMFGHRAGLFAALTLAALHFHIHFSRIGLNNIWDGLWYTVTIGALCIAWQSNKRWAYLLAGLALGFGLYFYVSARALYGIVLAGILIAAVFQKKRFQQALPDLFLMLLVTLAVVLPLAWFFIQQPNQFLAPMARVSFFKILENTVAASGEPAWKILAEQMGKGLQAYTLIPIRFWYNPETPILRPVFAAFFYLGLIVLLLKYRDSRFVLLSLWLVMFAVMGGLSESVPAAQRFVAAAPACVLIVGLGLHGTTEMFENLWQRSAKVFTGLSYAILCLAVLSDLYFYFFDFYGKSLIDNIESNGMIAQHVAKQVKDKPEGTQVAFFTIPNLGYYSIPSIQYLAPQVKGIDVPEPWSSFDRTQLNGDHIVFIIPEGREAEVLAVTQEYPNGYLYSDSSWDGELLFWVYDLP